MAFQRIIIPSIGLVFLLALPVYGQMINSPCTTSMLTSFTPCMNFITNSSFNGTSPTSDCCNVLKSVMSNGSSCLCMIATGGVPFNLPINRTLALSLPRACSMPGGVPLQCKASAAPIPAPGPLASSPAESPAAEAPSPIASSVPLGGSTTLAPEAGGSTTLAPEAAGTTPVLTPPTSTPTTNSGSPSTNTGDRQSVTPSAAASTKSFSPLFVLALIGAIAWKNY